MNISLFLDEYFLIKKNYYYFSLISSYFSMNRYIISQKHQSFLDIFKECHGVLQSTFHDFNKLQTCKASIKYSSDLLIDARKSEHECVVIPLRIDALSVVPRDASLSDMYRVLVESLRRQLAAAEQCVLTELHHTRRISPPEPHHFQPAPLGHALTLMLPRDVPDADLAGLRERRHDVFLLTKDRPLFRRGCSHVFPSDVPSNVPLFNPHEGLQPPALRNAETSLVRGRYRYYHYLQDGIEDNGWGCAYRSLQTLASWFRLQGYTDVPVPSHRDIQQCLVNIGDKPSNFIGSRQWIGSTEVSFCLETLLGVSSRILSVSSGPELCTRADELLRHFDTHGTPIMVGGGVLAHTILGVSLERESGEVRFLILDPHYIGPEELPTVLSKTGCVWKGPDFWMKSAFYNLCMPQRPHAIF
ncbi:hypothetical protein B566_EDAN001904 [Ephemera danica]|nr:hypothetical protein B566_EDAN001904 [Ephemera danica]